MIFVVYIPCVMSILATCWCIYTDHNVWAIIFFTLVFETLPTYKSGRGK